MADAPQLPESPFRALDDGHTGARLTVWRRRTLAVSTMLICAFIASTLAFLISEGWPSSSHYLEDVVAPFAMAAPSLLLGLVGLQAGVGSRQIASAAAVTGAVLAACGTVGHAWLIDYVSQYPRVLTYYSVAGIAGDTGVMVLPVLRRTRIARHATAVAIMACMLAPIVLLHMNADDLPDLFRDPWQAIIAAGLLPAPILGALALLWLVFREPRE